MQQVFTNYDRLYWLISYIFIQRSRTGVLHIYIYQLSHSFSREDPSFPHEWTPKCFAYKHIHFCDTPPDAYNYGCFSGQRNREIRQNHHCHILCAIFLLTIDGVESVANTIRLQDNSFTTFRFRGNLERLTEYGILLICDDAREMLSIDMRPLKTLYAKLCKKSYEESTTNVMFKIFYAMAETLPDLMSTTLKEETDPCTLFKANRVWGSKKTTLLHEASN